MAENNNEVLILMDNVQKVFMTDEVETHALAGIHMQLKRGNSSPSTGHLVAENQHCFRFSDCWILPSDGNYTINNKPVSNLFRFPERTRIRNREIGFIFRPSI